MTDVSIVGAVLAGLVSFLSPCVLPLVPGYASMLSGIGMEQLRQGQPPRVGLFATSLAFVAGFSFVFISFGASASAVGQFLRENRALLAPVTGALILMFGLHLLGWLGKLSSHVGIILGVLLVTLGFVSAPVRLLALEVDREDTVSLGRAAELCQTPLAAFMDFAVKHRPPLRYSIDLVRCLFAIPWFRRLRRNRG
jgi:cytochrome c biogenesis protein CcdA